MDSSNSKNLKETHSIPMDDNFLNKVGNSYYTKWKELNKVQKKEFKKEILWWIKLLNKNLTF